MNINQFLSQQYNPEELKSMTILDLSFDDESKWSYHTPPEGYASKAQLSLIDLSPSQRDAFNEKLRQFHSLQKLILSSNEIGKILLREGPLGVNHNCFFYRATPIDYPEPVLLELGNHLQKTLSLIPTLEILDLSGNDLSELSIHLVSFMDLILSGCPQINKLVLSGNDFSIQNFEAILPLIQAKCQNIKGITLGYLNKKKTPGVNFDKLFDIIKTFDSLEVINFYAESPLDYQNISDEEIMYYHEKLQELNCTNKLKIALDPPLLNRIARIEDSVLVVRVTAAYTPVMYDQWLPEMLKHKNSPSIQVSSP